MTILRKSSSDPVDAGSAAVLSMTDPYANCFPGATSSLVLSIPRRHIPRRRLAVLVAMPEDRLAQSIPAGTEALRLLVDYVEMGLRRHRLASPELGQLFASHVRDLVVLVIGELPEGGRLFEALVSV